MKQFRTTALSLIFFLALVAVPGLALQPAGASETEAFMPFPKVPAVPLQSALDEAFYDYQVFEMDFEAINAQVRQSGQLSLFLGNQRFDLELEKNDLRAAGYRRVLVTEGERQVEMDPGPVTTFKGRVVGDPKSIVRLTVTPELFTGYVRTEEDWIFLDPVSDFVRSGDDFLKASVANEVVVYRDEDVRGAKGGQCGVEAQHGLSHLELPGARADFLESDFFESIAQGPEELGQFRTLEVATDCDGEYYERYGYSGAISRINGILNDIEGVIYGSELNLGINVVFQQCWMNPGNDIYTSRDIGRTLDQMRSWWNANHTGIDRDVAHLFSNKNFNGNAIGIAWVGVVCNAPGFSYGVSQNVGASRARRRLTAHEIGHNLSARHDNQQPVCPGVVCNGNGPIMCSFIQSGSSSAADDFSSCSRIDIGDHIDNFGSCI